MIFFEEEPFWSNRRRSLLLYSVQVNREINQLGKPVIDCPGVRADGDFVAEQPDSGVEAGLEQVVLLGQVMMDAEINFSRRECGPDGSGFSRRSIYHLHWRWKFSHFAAVRRRGA